MPSIEDVVLTIHAEPKEPRLIKFPIRPLQAEIQVAFTVNFTESDDETFHATIQILGGRESDREKLFDLEWQETLCIDATGFSPFGGTLCVPVRRHRITIKPGDGASQPFTRKETVLRNLLNEDPSREIRFAEGLPPDFPNPFIPDPDDPAWFPDGPSVPMPIFDEAIDYITAQVLLTGSESKVLYFGLSNTVSGRF